MFLYCVGKLLTFSLVCCYYTVATLLLHSTLLFLLNYAIYKTTRLDSTPLLVCTFSSSPSSSVFVEEFIESELSLKLFNNLSIIDSFMWDNKTNSKSENLANFCHENYVRNLHKLELVKGKIRCSSWDYSLFIQGNGNYQLQVHHNLMI